MTIAAFSSTLPAMKLGSKLRFILVASTVLLVLAGLFYLLQPMLAQMGMTAILREAGFKQARIEKTERRPGGYAFLNATLDGNQFSTIERMTLQGKTLTIDKMVLTGEWKKLNAPDIAGWTGRPRLSALAAKIAARGIGAMTLNGGQLDVSLPWLGLVRLEAKGMATLLPDGALRLQSTVWSVQQKMKTHMTVNGEFAPNGLASLDAEITEGKLDIPGFSASRLGGWVILNRDQAGRAWNISGQLMAGTAALWEMTLNSLVLSVQGTTLESALALQASGGGSDPAATPLAVDMTLRRNGEDHIAATFRVDSLGENRPGAVFIYDSRGQTMQSLFNTGNLGIADLAGDIWMKGTLRRDARGAEIDIQEVRLQPLADAFGMLDLTIDGAMTGLLPLGRDQNGKLAIQQGLLRSAVPGHLSLAGNTLPPPLTATRDDAAKILKAFLYEKIELLVSGIPFDTLGADVSMTGKSSLEKDAKPTLVTLQVQRD